MIGIRWRRQIGPIVWEAPVYTPLSHYVLYSKYVLIFHLPTIAYLRWIVLLRLILSVFITDLFYCGYCFPVLIKGLYSLSGKTSYHKISWSLEAARLGFKLFQSLWNLAGTSAALLPMCLSNFRAIRPLQHPISRLRDFTRRLTA